MNLRTFFFHFKINGCSVRLLNMNKRITNQKSIYWFQWSSAGNILPHRTLICRPDCLIVDNPRSLIIFNHYRPQPISLQNKKNIYIKKKYKIQRSPVSSWLAKIERVSIESILYSKEGLLSCFSKHTSLHYNTEKGKPQTKRSLLKSCIVLTSA